MDKLTFATLVLLASAPVTSAGELTITVPTGDGAGTVRAAVFDSQQAFETDTPVAYSAVAADAGKTTLQFGSLGAGTYGVALFVDVNGNERLDRNLLGAPTEPFGFSQNPTIGFSAPKFDAFKFDVGDQPMTMTVSLNGG